MFWLNHVLLFLILDVDTQVNKQYFSICNENAPRHTDIVWKGLVLQTRTWKWTAVILLATSCISNSSSKSNNSSNNVITAINNSSDINNSELQRMGQTFVKSKWRYRQTGLSNAARQTGGKKYKLPADSKRPAFSLKKGSPKYHQSVFTSIQIKDDLPRRSPLVSSELKTLSDNYNTDFCVLVKSTIFKKMPHKNVDSQPAEDHIYETRSPGGQGSENSVCVCVCERLCVKYEKTFCDTWPIWPN